VSHGGADAVVRTKKKVTFPNIPAAASSLESEQIVSAQKTVSVATVTKSSRRVWDKKLACYFCGKLLKSKISEHMARVHCNEADVARILAKPAGSAERKLGWEKLKNLGNFNHNVETLRAGNGEVIVRRRATKGSPDEFLPCEFCYGFFRCHLLWKHVKHCLCKPRAADTVKHRRSGQQPTAAGSSNPSNKY